MGYYNDIAVRIRPQEGKEVFNSDIKDSFLCALEDELGWDAAHQLWNKATISENLFEVTFYWEDLTGPAVDAIVDYQTRY